MRAARFAIGAPGDRAGGIAPGTVTVVSGTGSPVLLSMAGASDLDAYGTAVRGCGDLDGAGTGGLTPRIDGGLCPAPGTPTSIEITNGLGGALGIVIYGALPTSIPVMGGTLLVWPLNPQAVVSLGGTPGAPGAGWTSLGLNLPPNPLLSGIQIFWQGLFLDPGAPRAVSFTDGLDMTIA